MNNLAHHVYAMFYVPHSQRYSGVEQFKWVYTLRMHMWAMPTFTFKDVQHIKLCEWLHPHEDCERSSIVVD